MRELNFIDKFLSWFFERKLFCRIGWHTWQWKIESGDTIYLDGEIPNKAKCKHCKTPYSKG